MNMKYLFITALAAASVASLNAQPTPLYEFGFNDNGSGTTTASTGSSTVTADLFYHSSSGNAAMNLRGEDGSGVSGQAGDYALDLTGATQMGGGSSNPGYGGVAYASSATFNDARSETIAFWYNAAVEPTGYARAFNAGYSAMLFAPGGEARVTFQMSGASNKTITVTDEVFQVSGEWVFFAATFDSATGQATIYAGTKADGTLNLIGTQALDSGIAISSSSQLVIGSNDTYERPFKGLMDDFTVWTDEEGSSAALSQSQLQDVMNASIPEPSQSVALLAVIAGAMLLFFRRRRG